MPDSLLAHIHVPKCAGTSFRLLLDRVFAGNQHLSLYYEPGTDRNLSTTFIYTDQQLASLTEPSSVRAFSSHYVRRFPEFLSGRPVHYVTFLREPVQQFVSYLGFTRQVYGQIKDPVLLSHLPPGMPNLSLRECARWLMRQNSTTFLNFRENYNTNFFARYELETKLGLDYASPKYRRIRLAAARDVLGRFFFVGMSGRMDDSWRLLSGKLSTLGMEIDDLPVQCENVSGHRDDDLSWLNPRDGVGRAVLASMREDLRLYRWAQRKFTRQLIEHRRGAPLRWWQRLRTSGRTA